MGPVEVGAAHREVPRMNLVVQGERLLRLDRRRLPGVLVELGQRYRLAAGFGTDGDDVAGEIADQVAAGNPRGRANRWPAGSGCATGS